jgi:hypothetical protein
MILRLQLHELYETLKNQVIDVLKSLENKTVLFESLLLSYPERL